MTMQQQQLERWQAGTEVRVTRRVVGSVVGSVGGAVFVVMNAGAVRDPGTTMLRVLAVAALAWIVVRATRLRREPSSAADARSSFGRGYWVVVAAEVVVGLAGAEVIGGPLNVPALTIAWISLVVGVHFFGLAGLWHRADFTSLGAVITAVATAGFIAYAMGGSRAVVALLAGVLPGIALLAYGYAGTRSRPEAGDM